MARPIFAGKGELVTKKEELMGFLHKRVFDPILNSHTASNLLKQGVRLAVMKMSKMEPAEILRFYTVSMIGTDQPTKFALQMKNEGFTQFEEAAGEIRDRFDEDWLGG
jgi:hypothetical protein